MNSTNLKNIRLVKGNQQQVTQNQRSQKRNFQKTASQISMNKDHKVTDLIKVNKT